MCRMPGALARQVSSKVAGVVLICAGVVVAAPVRAEIHGIRPEAHLNLAFHGDLGFGARLDIPVVPEGFLISVEDELAISPGADLLFDDGELWAAVPIAVQWNFYLAREWSVFPELGLALLFGHHHRKRRDQLALDFLLAVGGRWHFSDRNALVLRLGWPVGVQFGITF